MKLLPLLLFFNIISVLTLHAQITITEADMPPKNIKYIISHSNDFDLVNPELTGPDYSWDFRSLKNSNQITDTIMSITSAPQMYQFVFNSFIDPKPTLCIPVYILNNQDSLNKYKITDIFEYYRTTTQDYSYVGFGMTFKGIAVPVKYDTTDILYRFPLSYGNSDSSTSHFETPSLISDSIYFSSHQKRINYVDGWGTLKTPFGSFSTLRVKSTVYATDTIYNPKSDTGYRFNRPVKYEYKWLGQNAGIPLLQINTEFKDSVEVVTDIMYQDTIRVNAISKASISPINIRIYPNPFHQNTTIEYNIVQNGYVSIELIDFNGNIIKKLQSGFKNPGCYNVPLFIDNYPSSVLFIKFRFNNQVQLQKITYTR